MTRDIGKLSETPESCGRYVPVMRFRIAAIVAIVLLGSLVAGRAPTTGVASAGVVRAQQCGSARTIPRYQHVIWIWMENHSYDAVVGSSAAPFTNGLRAHCGLGHQLP